MIEPILKEPEGKTFEFKKEVTKPASFEKTLLALAYLTSVRAHTALKGPSGLVVSKMSKSVSKTLSKMNSLIYESLKSLWMLQKEIVILFSVNVPVIFYGGELDQKVVVSILEIPT